ncbi:hypothetical protein ACRRTK_002549 [Alexandromys fortis]
MGSFEDTATSLVCIHENWTDRNAGQKENVSPSWKGVVVESESVRSDKKSKSVDNSLYHKSATTTIKEHQGGTEEDVQVKVERLSVEEVHEEVSEPVSASQSSLSGQQTVLGSKPVQEVLLISPQSSPIGSVDEGVTERLPTLQITSGTSAHTDDDDRKCSVSLPTLHCSFYQQDRATKSKWSRQTCPMSKLWGSIH